MCENYTMFAFTAVAYDNKSHYRASKCVSTTNKSLSHMIKKQTVICLKMPTYYLINFANIPSFIKIYCPDPALKKGNQKL